jgi:hypothetical protein
MSCCGGKRARFRSDAAERALYVPARPGTAGRVYFQYLGGRPVRVVGAGTGRAYLFGWPGATVAVDPRDAPSVATVPGLRQVTVR